MCGIKCIFLAALQQKQDRTAACFQSSQRSGKTMLMTHEGRPWKVQPILRASGTYMVIKIPSMHIPRSLNTALSVSLLHPLSALSSSVFLFDQSPTRSQICNL